MGTLSKALISELSPDRMLSSVGWIIVPCTKKVWVQSPPGNVWEAIVQCFSLSVSFPSKSLPLSLKLINKIYT